MGMKVREVIRMIEADGWVRVGQKGSHRQYRHRMKPGRVTISGNDGKDMPIGILNSVLRQAGLKG